MFFYILFFFFCEFIARKSKIIQTCIAYTYSINKQKHRGSCFFFFQVKKLSSTKFLLSRLTCHHRRTDRAHSPSCCESRRDGNQSHREASTNDESWRRPAHQSQRPTAQSCGQMGIGSSRRAMRPERAWCQMLEAAFLLKLFVVEWGKTKSAIVRLWCCGACGLLRKQKQKTFEGKKFCPKALWTNWSWRNQKKFKNHQYQCQSKSK